MATPKKIAFLVAFNLALCTLATVVGEIGLRWWTIPALRHLLLDRLGIAPRGAAPADSPWILPHAPDPDLRYRLDPTHPRVNSIGIRGNEISPQPPAGPRKLVFLGDSVSFPFRLPPDQGFVAICAESLQASMGEPLEVINASVQGFTTYQERVLFQRDLAPHCPDLTILVYCANDNNQFTFRLLKGTQTIWRDEFTQRHLIPHRSDWFQRLFCASYLLQRLRRGFVAIGLIESSPYPWNHWSVFCPAWRDDSWDAFRENLVAISGIIRRFGGRFAVVAVPRGDQFRADLLSMDQHYVLKPQQKLNEICAAEDIPFLDLHPVLGDDPPNSLFVDDVHFTPYGHQTVAAALLDFIEEANLLSVDDT